MTTAVTGSGVAPRLPRIIQGGMGVAVSNWRMARAVSRLGGLGVVSGTAIDTVLVRRLQDGDPDGDLRRAMAHFPMQDVAQYVLRRFFREGGRARGEAYRLLPMYKQAVPVLHQQITMLAAFVEVSLAREGHDGMVGMNLLAKIQMPTLPLLYGAMLAGVNAILMGAGIPRDIPGALDAMAQHQPTAIKFDVLNAGTGPAEELKFDPREAYPGVHDALKRPLFFPIVAAASLAQMLSRKANGRVDGFIVEGPTAGGHNAPPRGALKVDAAGEPIYGERDVVDLAAMREIGLPFWIAGGSGSPEGLERALAAGAAGIQVGTLFAYSDESGFAPAIRARVIDGALKQQLEVRTDVRASPTGYPFKLVITAPDLPAEKVRKRVCDLGYLREAVRRDDGKIIYRCASEPVDQYIAKGGTDCDAAGRRCLCNALCAAIGEPQVRADGDEPALITSGDEVKQLATFLEGRTHYAAADVIAYLTRKGAIRI